MAGRLPAGTHIRGRAVVVPASTGNVGHGEDGNVNNFTANARVRSSTVLVARSAADNQPVETASRRIEARLPNWLRIVMYYSGNNDGPWRELPPELDVPVWIDAYTRQVVALDVDAAAAELSRYRDVGRREWLDTEAPLGDVRGLIALPGMALRGLRAIPREVRSLIADIRSIGGGPQPPMSAEEPEVRRRTAMMLRHNLDRNPKERDKIRRSVLQAGPSITQSAAAGAVTPQDFEVWISHHELSGVISAEEVAQWRLDGRPSDT